MAPKRKSWEDADYPHSSCDSSTICPLSGEKSLLSYDTSEPMQVMVNFGSEFSNCGDASSNPRKSIMKKSSRPTRKGLKLRFSSCVQVINDDQPRFTIHNDTVSVSDNSYNDDHHTCWEGTAIYSNFHLLDSCSSTESWSSSSIIEEEDYVDFSTHNEHHFNIDSWCCCTTLSVETLNDIENGSVPFSPKEQEESGKTLILNGDPQGIEVVLSHQNENFGAKEVKGVIATDYIESAPLKKPEPFCSSEMNKDMLPYEIGRSFRKIDIEYVTFQNYTNHQLHCAEDITSSKTTNPMSKRSQYSMSSRIMKNIFKGKLEKETGRISFRDDDVSAFNESCFDLLSHDSASVIKAYYHMEQLQLEHSEECTTSAKLRNDCENTFSFFPSQIRLHESSENAIETELLGSISDGIQTFLVRSIDQENDEFPYKDNLISDTATMVKDSKRPTQELNSIVTTNTKGTHSILFQGNNNSRSSSFEVIEVTQGNKKLQICSHRLPPECSNEVDNERVTCKEIKSKCDFNNESIQSSFGSPKSTCTEMLKKNKLNLGAFSTHHQPAEKKLRRLLLLFRGPHELISLGNDANEKTFATDRDRFERNMILAETNFHSGFRLKISLFPHQFGVTCRRAYSPNDDIIAESLMFYWAHSTDILQEKNVSLSQPFCIVPCLEHKSTQKLHNLSIKCCHESSEHSRRCKNGEFDALPKSSKLIAFSDTQLSSRNFVLDGFERNMILAETDFHFCFRPKISLFPRQFGVIRCSTFSSDGDIIAETMMLYCGYIDKIFDSGECDESVPTNEIFIFLINDSTATSSTHTRCDKGFLSRTVISLKLLNEIVSTSSNIWRFELVRLPIFSPRYEVRISNRNPHTITKSLIATSFHRLDFVKKPKDKFTTKIPRNTTQSNPKCLAYFDSRRISKLENKQPKKESLGNIAMPALHLSKSCTKLTSCHMKRVDSSVENPTPIDLVEQKRIADLKQRLQLRRAVAIRKHVSSIRSKMRNLNHT